MLTILTSYSVKGLQAVNVDLGYFTASGYGSINFISVIVYGPIHLAFSLRNLPRRTVSSKSRNLSICNLISLIRLFIVFLVLTLTRDQVLVGVVDELYAIGFSVRKHNHNSYIEVQAAFFKAEGKTEGRPNNNSNGVNPVAECMVVLYTHVTKGTHSSQLVWSSFT